LCIFWVFAKGFELQGRKLQKSQFGAAGYMCLMGGCKMPEALSIDQKNKIEEIISQIKCDKDFECYKSNFTRIGKVKDIGLKSFVECQAKKPTGCRFMLPFGHSYLCQCPLRVYASKVLQK
jgi:hypothetical protein